MRLKSPPPFLRGVQVSAAEHERLYDLSSNWMRLHKHLKEMSEDDLRRLLVVELAGRKRLHIICRVKNRHDAMRKQREDTEILELREGVA